MERLTVRNSDFLSTTKLKAQEDAKKMQASVVDECTKAGKDVPAYQLQELIGKGSFGRVYKATDLNRKALVAVKIIDIEESDTLNPKLADTYSEFLKEINALKLLSDSGAKNVNLILDALPVGQSMWMVTEYCAGGSVATLMKPTAPGGLQEKWIIPILREVAEAVYWVHKEGIIHRDIKCANVLVTEEGGVQLCDFGVAGIIETKFDKRSTFIGTLHWMAPELFDENLAYGTPVDIWAFGSLVYEIASGLPPNVMAGFNIPQLGDYIKTHAPRLEGDQYSDQIKDLVSFCLVEDPAKRPTIERVQQHPYLFNTSASYPTSALANLVKGYKVWEAQGGIRRSLFSMAGAIGPSDYASTAVDNDEWNFSTTVDFDRQVMDTDAQAVYDVYGSNVDFDFNEDAASRPQKPKSRRRMPPQLQALKAPLEKVFDPNTMSNYDENSRVYYGRPPPPPTSTSDLPLRDDSLHSTLRESLIDLDASFDGDELSRFVDMETIKAGPRASTDNVYHPDLEEVTDFSKPPLSDPADLGPNINRRTQDWKFPAFPPPASANPEMSRFPFNEPGPGSNSAGRPPLIHHPTDPVGMHSQPAYDLLPAPTQPQNNRPVSVGSLIDLDESLPDSMPELTRPSTANSDVVSVSGSDIGGANPFDLERHASLYQPSFNAPRAREPSIYISDDSYTPSQPQPPQPSQSSSSEDLHMSEFGMPGPNISINSGFNSTNGSVNGNGNGSNGVSTGSHTRENSEENSYSYSYDGDDSYSASASEYLDSEYLTLISRLSSSNSIRQSRRMRSPSAGRHQHRQHLQQQQRQASHSQTSETTNGAMNGGGGSSSSSSSSNRNSDTDLPLVPDPPSARVMQGMATREEVREDVMRLLASFSEHLGFANAHLSSLPVRKAGPGGGGGLGLQAGAIADGTAVEE
ncbi:STE/STE20/YSK protein kinase [Diplogelasinospora grovesii]|uniref:non-specific serine/threonine protein kinase n=1 Tax=Diplogelasinospora grovesii TaxID=303347 RepID=A0AAN6N5V1_9PEZI|nr:STE/STE20/YSK protein kinase [Diplogelasinospora grovesii]